MPLYLLFFVDVVGVVVKPDISVYVSPPVVEVMVVVGIVVVNSDIFIDVVVDIVVVSYSYDITMYKGFVSFNFFLSTEILYVIFPFILFYVQETTISTWDLMIFCKRFNSLKA